MRKWITTVRGERIAFTGRAWLTRAALRRQVLRKRGIPTPGAAVTSTTTILVRGDSSVWAFGEYGTKEREAAKFIRKGASISLIHDFEFRKVLENGRPARVADRIAGEPVLWLAPVTKRQFYRAAIKEGPLDREHTILGRLEQSYLRHALFGEAELAICSLCGRRLPVGLLIAAHLKPRSECTRSERLDVKNIVSSMCLLGCDAFYERGFVAVHEAGRILVSNAQSSRAANVALQLLRGRSCSAWKASTAKYFDWHRKRRFQGSRVRNTLKR